MMLDVINGEMSSSIAPNILKKVLRTKHLARRFVITDDVVRTAGELIRDYPDTLLRNIQFAEPPYETTYIEMDLELFLDVLGARRTVAAGPPDKCMGYLIHKNEVYGLVMAAKDNVATVMPQCYTIWNHHPPVNCIPSHITSKFGRIGHILGSTYTNPKSSLSHEIEDHLLMKYRCWWDAEWKKKFGDDERIQKLNDMFSFSVGDLRNMMTFLLWINQPHLVDIVDIPATRGWLKNKNIAYAAHHEIRLKKNMTRRKLMSAFIERATARAHQVRGFWRNFQKTECDHVFPLLPDDDGRYQCRRCPQWRIWVREYERGDASKGYVTKTYKV